MLATAPHAITAIKQTKTVIKPARRQMATRATRSQKPRHAAAESGGKEGVAVVTVLRADVLTGLALAEDVGGRRCDRHGCCGGEVGGEHWSAEASARGFEAKELARSNEVL